VKLLNRLTPALKQAVRDAGKASFAQYGFSGIFNMQSPFVEQWLWKYVPKLAGEISEEDRRRIMDALREGILMGEGVDDLARRLGDVMDDWDRYRSRLVGRTEAIRASNKGALESYRQSGVVEAKQWSANPTACEICLELDGKIIELDESYIGLGEAMPITERINDYADIEGPPAHPACLCVLLPVIVGLEGGGAEEE
jgi:SPP1 gp7 family putative phage head morphogenesis protein